MIRSVTTALLFCPALLAQGIHVAPRDYASADAPALAAIPGIGVSDRGQILIDGRLLTEIAGRDITGLAFRRDASDSTAFSGGSANMVVRIGPAQHSADQARASFVANLSAPTEVFRGVVSIPASPAPAAVPPWTTPYAVEIAFSQPYRYAGGPLCIDITGAVANEFWWPVDAAEEPAQGSAASVGHACGRLANVHGETASIAERDLVVGETVICSLFGEPGASAFLLFGTDTLSSPVDLTFIGSPGCELRVNAFVAMPTVVSAPPLDPVFGGIAEQLLHLPHDAQLMGAEFVTQWCELPPTGLVTSNTLRTRVAGLRPSMGMSLVWSRGGGEPIVQFTRVPVVGLRWE